MTESDSDRDLIRDKTGLAPSRVRNFLSRIRETVSLTQAHGPCAECARPSTTYQIG